MTVGRRIQYFAAWAACCGMLSPIAVFGAPAGGEQVQTASAAAVRDAALRDGNVLQGQLVDSMGQGLAQVQVSVRSLGQTVAEGQTDAQGYFSIAGLRGGVYELQAASATGVYRVWNPQMAPPSAVNSLLLVDQSANVVRGQYADPYAGGNVAPYAGQMGGVPCGDCGPGPMPCGPQACGPGCGPGGKFGWLCNPWIIGGAIVAAIAIPLALSDDDDDDAS